MIIISPAKNLNILPEKLPIQLSEPFFINDTNSLASKLKKLQFDKLKKLMNILNTTILASYTINIIVNINIIREDSNC